MTCRGKDRLIARYLAGELDTKGHRQIKEHLAECPRCKEAARDLARITAALGILRQETLPEQLAAPFRFPETHPATGSRKTAAPSRRFVGRFALPLSLAAVALILGTLGTLWMALQTRPRNQVTVNTAKSRAHTLSRIPAATQAPPSTDSSKAVVNPRNPCRTSTQPRVSQGGQATAHGETFVLRLQTDDPGVVVYWQFNGSGGKS